MSSFSEIINSDKPTVVDFFAEWCGPCKMMAPVLQQFKKEVGENVQVLKVDVDKNPQAAMQYKVQAVPTLLVFQNGQVKWRHSGVVSALQLRQVISKLQSGN